MDFSKVNSFMHSKKGKIFCPVLIGLSIYLINYSVLKSVFYLYPTTIPLTMGKGSWWLSQTALVKILYAGLFAPFFEELIFRRGILNWFILNKQFILGLFVSSALFGFWHMLSGWGILKAVDMMLIGIVFGLVYNKYQFKGSLLAHYSNNFLSLVFMLLLV
ncbi:MAG: CPBP family intramembrane metalloprotease [Candidatus Aenigmarchaeota archaeon]|nr:CPBP family intramembrane metalloprotease [Candidatus Aenigmarchaeota archaeon]